MAQRLHRLGHIGLLVEVAAGDEHVDARPDAEGRGLAVDAAIHHHVDAGLALADVLDLVEAFADETLGAKAGMDRHYEDLVDNTQELLELFDRRFGVDGDGGAKAQFADADQGVAHVAIGLHVDLDRLCAGLGEGL